MIIFFASGRGDQNSHSLEFNRCNWLYFLHYDIGECVMMLHTVEHTQHRHGF